MSAWESRWAFLSQSDAIVKADANLMGVPIDRVYYLGTICGRRAQEDWDGLPTHFDPRSQRWMFSLHMETAERILRDALALNREVIKAKLAGGGVTQAKKVRQVWDRQIELLVVEAKEGQRAELLRRTEQLLIAWEEELIPQYLAKQPTLTDLVSERESALDEREKDMRHNIVLKRKIKKRESGVEVPHLPAPNPYTRAVEPLKLDPSSRAPPRAQIKEPIRQPHLPSMIPQLEAVVARQQAELRKEQRLLARLRELEDSHRRLRIPPAQEFEPVIQGDRNDVGIRPRTPRHYSPVRQHQGILCR